MTTSHRFALIAALSSAAAVAGAAEFHFGNNANLLTGQTSGVVTVDGVQMSLTANPAGGVFYESSVAGLGVDSIAVPGATDLDRDKFSILRGDAGIAGTAETLTFSFDTAGVITAIDFDGVKDESLEYFILTGESGQRVTFFDSAANVSVPGAVDAAVLAGAVTGDVVFLLEGGGFDDETFGLSIPFAAGETLTLTYAELDAQFGPLQAGNGSRLQGLTVTAIPEPAALALAVVACCGVSRRR